MKNLKHRQKITEILDKTQKKVLGKYKKKMKPGQKNFTKI